MWNFEERVFFGGLQPIEWCNDASSITSTGVKTTSSTLRTTLGEEVCMNLCVKKMDSSIVGATPYPVMVREVTVEVSGEYPYDGQADSPFMYPFDEISFPPSGTYVIGENPDDNPSDPFEEQYCFSPQEGEECVYTACFEGYYLTDVTTARCYKIAVYNKVLYFDEDSTDLASSEGVSNMVKPENGMFMSAWVYPSCKAKSNLNMTIMAFKSERAPDPNNPDPYGPGDTGLDIRNSINYNPDTQTFFYYDCYNGEAISKPEYCCDKWHYVGVSIGEDGYGTLYVDGVAPMYVTEHKRDLIKFSKVPFYTKSRPDTGQDESNDGQFLIGENFTGYIDEIGVWDTNKTDAEYEQLRYKRTLTDADGAQRRFDMSTNVPKLTHVTVVDMPIPTIVPCVLGMEHNVGPVDGDCTTQVYGWNFCDSTLLKCGFGDIEVMATFGGSGGTSAGVNSGTSYGILTCDTPGHVSPRFVDVTASNDGRNFTNTETAGKTVRHLFLESSLYVTGEGNGGAQADSVCLDLPTKAVTFGAW
eukprot:gene10663-12611_t